MNFKCQRLRISKFIVIQELIRKLNSIYILILLVLRKFQFLIEIKKCCSFIQYKFKNI